MTDDWGFLIAIVGTFLGGINLGYMVGRGIGLTKLRKELHKHSVRDQAFIDQLQMAVSEHMIAKLAYEAHMNYLDHPDIDDESDDDQGNGSAKSEL
jgi:hypothetical protein